MKKGTKIPFAIDNDANVAALGERWKGAGDNNPDVIFITLGTGVGGGIIMEGQLLHGVAGCAGEIGHITVDPEGFECTCGKRGCFRKRFLVRRVLCELLDSWQKNMLAIRH